MLDIIALILYHFVVDREARCEAIVNYLLANGGRARVSELATQLSVSRMTVLRDIQTLLEQGKVKKGYGEVRLERPVLTLPLPDSINREIAEKRAIGYAASQLVTNGDAIFIGGGTTTLQMIPFLAQRDQRPRIVATHSLLHAIMLYNLFSGTETRVVIIGGDAIETNGTLVGPLANHALQMIKVDKAFIGADGVDLETGVTEASTVVAETSRAALRVARERVLLVTSTKFNKSRHGHVASLGDINIIITDERVPTSLVQRLRAMGVKIIIARQESLTQGTTSKQGGEKGGQILNHM